LNVSAIPNVSIVKAGSFHERKWREANDEVRSTMAANMAAGYPAGFVAEGLVPYSVVNPTLDGALRSAVLHGMPVVMVGRGNPTGFAANRDLFIAGNNLTATKARLLLMAALLRYGCLPPARNPNNPTETELANIQQAVARIQATFDTH
jgi:hypothetical protein